MKDLKEESAEKKDKIKQERRGMDKKRNKGIT
jgi:hypothetical protein